jgi:hypothetical protein
MSMASRSLPSTDIVQKNKFTSNDLVQKFNLLSRTDTADKKNFLQWHGPKHNLTSIDIVQNITLLPLVL